MGVCDEPLAAQGLRAELIRARVAWRDEVCAARRGRRAASIAFRDYPVHFDAPSDGKLAIDWYHLPRVAARRSRPGPVRMASASQSVRGAGTVSVKIKLSPSGRSLLAHAEREQLTATASFAPTGGPAARSSQVITVARRPHR